MVAINRFKQDFGYYFLGALLPGLLNAAMIPVLKRMLGTELFGAYSLKMNFLLLLLATILGGLCQGIIRFKASAEENLQLFYNKIFFIGWLLLLPFATISFFTVKYYFHQTFFLSLLYAISIIGCGIQNMAIAISQANFKSKYIIFSEGVRASTFFLCTIFFLFVFKHNLETYIFLALLVSYIVSFTLLLKKNDVHRQSIFDILPKQIIDYPVSTKAIIMYGLPLVLWFSVYYSILYIDKPLIAKHLGLSVQGNYQALSDMIFRGITFLLAPISTAIFPILNQNNKQDTSNEELPILKKIFLFEFLLLILALLAYWYFGFSLLAKLLFIPAVSEYKIAGALIIAFSIIWQMAMIVHKPLEIAKKTKLMFLFIIVSLSVYLLSFFSLHYFYAAHLFAYTLPCVLAAITYNIACLFFYARAKKIITV